MRSLLFLIYANIDRDAARVELPKSMLRRWPTCSESKSNVNRTRTRTHTRTLQHAVDQKACREWRESPARAKRDLCQALNSCEISA